MNRSIYSFFIIVSFLALGRLSGQTVKKYWIFLDKKQVTQHARQSITYTEKTKQRLQKMGWEKDYSDYLPPVEIETKISQLTQRIHHYSRSLCAYSAEIKPGTFDHILALPVVTDIQKVGRSRQRRPIPKTKQPASRLSKPADFYGDSREQLEQLNVIAAHDAGLTGEGVRIAVIDAGFRKDHETFSRMLADNNLVAEYDFIDDDTNVQNETYADTVNNQHSHGTAVLSCITGYTPEKLIGSAYNAEILLAKSENTGSETRIEEDDYVAAVEWAEANGADIISSSLGYRDFDNFEYSYADLDGQTAVTTKAVNWVAQRGVLVVTAAGNDAQRFTDGGLISPADSPEVLTVGAVDSQGNIAYFSSHGPTYDKRIKPDICARGYRTTVANSYTKDYYIKSNGTSFATPLMAGSCALILEKFPGWTPQRVIRQLRQYADRSGSPDHRYGWGIPDIHTLIIESDSITIDIKTDHITVAPNPVRSAVKFYFRWTVPEIDMGDTYYLEIYNILGEKVFRQKLDNQVVGNISAISWNLRNKRGKKVHSGLYLVKIHGKDMQQLEKFTILK